MLDFSNLDMYKIIHQYIYDNIWSVFKCIKLKKANTHKKSIK